MASKGKKTGNQPGLAAQAMAGIGEVVGRAGELDLAQGSDALAAAQQIEMQSDFVAGLSGNDLDRTMALGAIAGQIGVASEIVFGLQLPELGAFLRTKSEELHAIAVESALRFAAGRALSAAMLDTSNQIGALGANEMLEGMARQELAEAALAASEEMVE